MELLSSLHMAILAPVEHGLHQWLVVTPPASPTSPYTRVGRLPSWSSCASWSSEEVTGEEALPTSALRSLRIPNQGGRHASAVSRHVSFSKGLEIGPSSPSRSPSSVRMSHDCSSAEDLARMHARQARFAAHKQLAPSNARFLM